MFCKCKILTRSTKVVRDCVHIDIRTHQDWFDAIVQNDRILIKEVLTNNARYIIDMHMFALTILDFNRYFVCLLLGVALKVFF